MTSLVTGVPKSLLTVTMLRNGNTQTHTHTQEQKSTSHDPRAHFLFLSHRLDHVSVDQHLSMSAPACLAGHQ